jgi:TP901 family phage tail tape measure protein
MAEANANIKFTADTSQALESIRQLQRSISRLYSDMARGAAGAQSATAGMQQNLINSVNATGQFTARLTTIRTTTESFTNALEKNKLSLGQYFKFGIASTEKFGSVFKTEFNTIEKVARERVKDLQTQYIKMGRDANGAMKAIAVRPTTLDMTNLGTQTAIAAQKQQIFNQLLKQGTTNLLNFGKNTQWAGRQLMVGFTIPLGIFAVQAARSFQQLEAQAINFKRVYGDLFTTPEQTEMALTDMRKLALEFTKLGVSVEETLALAAKVAQMGNIGADLTAQVTQATRLSVLGQMEQQEALDTTIGITNAFGISIEDLGEKVNFLNAAENQTILSIQDFNEAVPRAGSVVAQLGGGVEDLAFFLTAMREGGIEASQGANALKTSLARLISPTEVAKQELGALGINIGGIVEANAGNLRQTVIELALALDTLDPLDKARAIEQLFGKFQFARMSALFQNIIDEGSQATRVLDLMTMTTSELAQLADRELGRVEESAATKFTSAIQKFRAELAPIGESFLKLATPIIEWATGMIEAFNKLGEGGRGFVVGFLGVIGGLAPVLLMVIGLVANLVANLAKGVGLAFNFFKGLGGGSKNLAEQTEYMTSEQIEAQTVAASLNQTHQDLTQTFTGETTALGLLADAYKAAAAEMRLFQGPIMTAGGMASRPAARVAGFAKGRKVPGYNDGVIEVPGPKGKGDIIPAMLAPGEAVIPAKMAQRYGGLINAMIAGNIPGYFGGLGAASAMFGASGDRPVEASHVEGRTPKEFGATMMAWIQSLRDGATANQEHNKKILSSSVTVRMLGDEAEDGTRAVKTVVMSLDELSEYIKSNPTREFLTGGEVAGGTTIPEDREVNRAYNVVHPDGGQVAAGVPSSLESASIAGKRAQEALDSQTAMSVQYRDGLLRLVERGKLAEAAKEELAEADRQAAASGRELTAEQKATAQQQAFFRAREKEIIATRIAASNRSVSNSQAMETAERLLTEADERLAKVRASGIDDAAYLEKMEAEYGSLIFQEIQTKSRKGADVTIPAADIISVPAGQGRDRRFGSGRGSGSIVSESGDRATRGGGDLSARGASVSRVVAGRQQELEAMGYSETEAIFQALITGIDKFLKSSSPSERLAQTSKNAADGIDKGLEESIPELRQTGVELGEAINDGAEDSQGGAPATPGRRGNRRARMDETGTTDVMQGGEIIKTIYPPEVQQAQDLLAQVNLQNAAKAQAFGDSAAMVATKITDMSGKVAMAGFALTSLVGAATQIPGPLGEIAAKIMPVLGGMTALAGAVRMVNAQKLIEAVRNKATAVAVAFNAATTKVATTATVVNTLAKRGETIASAQLTIAKRANSVATILNTGLLGGLSAALMTLLGPVGLIVLGLAALGIAVYAIVKAYQNEQARIKGLGDAAALSAEQLKVLSDQLGIQFKESVFGSTVTAGEGALVATEQDEVSRLRESEGFKEEFGGVEEIGSIIRTLKDATDADATRILSAQAAQLTALAKTEEDLAKIPIVLRAQLEEAGKEGIDVNILLPDLSTLEGISQRVQETISPIANVGKLSSEQLSITRGEIESTVQVLEQMRAAGVIAPAEAAAQFDILAEAVAGMEDPGQKLKLMQGVLEDLNMDELTDGIKDADVLMAILQNTMMGLKIDPATLEIFKQASETDLFGNTTADPAIVAQAKQLTDELLRNSVERSVNNAKVAEAAEAQRIMSADMQAANESLAEQEETLNNQNVAYDRLIEAGFSAADAVKAVGNAALAAAIASAEAGPELDALYQRVADIAALEAEVEGKLGTGRGRGGGGGTPTSVLDEVTKKLRLFNRAQTSVTKGWDASMKAILDFANASNVLSGEFNGLNKQLRGIGLSENLIEMITGMDPDEYEKRKKELFIFDDKGNIVGMTAKLQSLNAAINAVVVGEFINTQEQLTNSVNNQITALNRLTAAGASYVAAYRAVQNTALAAAIATARSSEMIRAAANAAMEAQKMMDRFATINEEEERRKNIAKAVQAINKEFSNQAKILDYINRNRSKLSEAQISEILTNKDLTALILEPSIDPGALATALDNANKQAQLELSIKKLTVSGQDEIFQTGFGKAMDAFNAEGNKIEFEFEANIKDQRKIIKDAEEQIALLDFELQTYQNDLKDIEFQEDEINKAYDKRFEALDKIAEANQEISRQQQAQLDVADALSRGDIAGAARAVREAREASGEAAREQERRRLEQAQAAQLASLTSGRGLTREEAEARSLELEQQIFAIESDRLLPAEELVRLAELKRDADIESLEVLGKTREEYERIANAIDVARGNNWQSTEAIQEALNIAEQLIAELEKAKPIPVTAIVPAPISSGGGGSSGAPALAIAPASTPPKPTNTEANFAGGNLGYGRLSDEQREQLGLGVSSSGTVIDARTPQAPITMFPQFAQPTPPGYVPPGPPNPAAQTRLAKQNNEVFKSIGSGIVNAAVATGNFFASAGSAFVSGFNSLNKALEQERLRNDPRKNNTVGVPQGTTLRALMGSTGGMVEAYARGGMIIPKRMSIGGIARRSRSGPPLQMLEGGRVRGPGTDMSDSIPALLSNGEYVIRASAVRNVGEEFLNKLNGGKIKPTDKDGIPAFKGGGIVKKPSGPISIRQVEAAAAKKKEEVQSASGSDRALMLRAQAAQAAAAQAAPRAPLISAGKNQPPTVSQTAPPAPPPTAAPPPKFSDSFKMFDGTAVGAEKGFQNMAGAIASNETVQKFGNWMSGDTFGAGLTRGILATLSVPVEVMGAAAKNIVTVANPNATMQERLMALIPGAPLVQGVSNAFSGVLDSSKQKEMMFTQAGNYVADNRLFGATDAEGQARARLVAGALNLLGDPLLYAGGAGIVRATASTAARTANTTARSANALSDAMGTIAPPGLTNLAPITKYFPQNIASAVKNTKDQNYRLVQEVERPMSIGTGAPKPPPGAPVPMIKTSLDRTGLSPSIYQISRDSIKNGYITEGPLAGKVADSLKLKGFEDYGPQMSNMMANILDANIPYRVKRSLGFTFGHSDAGAEQLAMTRHWFTNMSDRLPGGIQASLLSNSAIHRSSFSDMHKSLLHPRETPVSSGRRFGPGTYFAQTLSQSEKLFSEFGENLFRMNMSPTAQLKTLFSRGYAKPEQIQKYVSKNFPDLYGSGTREIQDILENLPWDSPVIQGLMKKGFIGTKHGDAMTNWLVGTQKGFGLKPYASKTPTTSSNFLNNFSAQVSSIRSRPLIPRPTLPGSATGPAVPRPSQLQAFLDQKTLREIDIPLDTDFHAGVYSRQSNFMEDTFGKKYFVKDHLADRSITDDFTRQSLGYEFLAGRIGNMIGANTPQAYIIKRGEGSLPYQVATEAIPNSAGLAPKKMQDIIRSSSSPQKMLEDMLEGFVDYNEITPALNAVFQNNDLHRNNIMWDNLNKRFMQIDLGTSSPNPLKFPTDSVAYSQGRVYYPDRLDASTVSARNSMAVIRGGINDAINEAIDLNLLNRPSQLRLAEKARSLGFSINLDNQSLNPLRDAFKSSSITTDLSEAYTKIMKLDIDGLPSQVASQLGIKQTGLGNINSNLIETIRERASVLRDFGRITIGRADGEPLPRTAGGYRMGGLIPYKAMGGIFKSINTDRIPAMLTPGEYVVRRSAVENFGVDNLEKINNGTYSDGSMYNYNLSINVKSESNPEQIAKTVIDQIKRIDSQRIRGNRY